MHVVDFIAKHLQDRPLPKLKVEEVNTICAFTGEPITEGVKLQNAIKGSFNDYEYLRYDSDYVGLNFIRCTKNIINEKSSLRNYGYFVTDSKLGLIVAENNVGSFKGADYSRANLWDFIIKEKETPFVLCVTFNGKKHTSFKARINESNKQFIVTTDQGNVRINVVEGNNFGKNVDYISNVT